MLQSKRDPGPKDFEALNAALRKFADVYRQPPTAIIMHRDTVGHLIASAARYDDVYGQGMKVRFRGVDVMPLQGFAEFAEVVGDPSTQQHSILVRWSKAPVEVKADRAVAASTNSIDKAVVGGVQLFCDRFDRGPGFVYMPELAFERLKAETGVASMSFGTTPITVTFEDPSNPDMVAIIGSPNHWEELVKVARFGSCYTIEWVKGTPPDHVLPPKPAEVDVKIDVVVKPPQSFDVVEVCNEVAPPPMRTKTPYIDAITDGIRSFTETHGRRPNIVFINSAAYDDVVKEYGDVPSLVMIDDIPALFGGPGDGELADIKGGKTGDLSVIVKFPRTGSDWLDAIQANPRARERITSLLTGGSPNVSETQIAVSFDDAAEVFAILSKAQYGGLEAILPDNPDDRAIEDVDCGHIHVVKGEQLKFVSMTSPEFPKNDMPCDLLIVLA